MANFKELGIPDSILSAIEKIGYTEPTPIQQQAIPFALAGRDVLGSAQTGTGKTAAFGIPLIARLLENHQSMAIIMTPTRELAAQVLKTLQPLLLNHAGIRSALLIGGEPMPKQYQQLKARPRIIVGTPGRINDHLVRRSLNLSTADFLVLDEMDRMLDMGFGIQIDKILQYLPSKRQTLMFSATIPPEIVKLSAKYLVNPERVSVGSLTTAVPQIKQEQIHTTEGGKYETLLGQLYDRQGSIIVFVKTKHGAKRMAERLCNEDHKADTIHGNLQQNKRDRVIQSFRDKRFRILVATDVAARGLDIPHIEHVINYDLPQCPEDYIHRIGRTGRAGAEGCAVNLITPSDNRLWSAIRRLMNPGEKPEPRFSTNDRPQQARRRTSNGGGGYAGGQGRDNDKYANRSGFNDRNSRPERSFARKDEGSFSAPRPAREEGSFAARPPREEKSFSRPREEGVFTRRPSGDRPASDRPRSDRPSGDRPRSDRPAGERSFGARPAGDRNFSDRPRSDRPSGDRPFRDRPAGGRPSGDRPRSDRPSEGRSFRDRPRDDKRNAG